MLADFLMESISFPDADPGRRLAAAPGPDPKGRAQAKNCRDQILQRPALSKGSLSNGWKGELSMTTHKEKISCVWRSVFRTAVRLKNGQYLRFTHWRLS